MSNFVSRYDVPPFSGENYSRNRERCPIGATPCAICGKPVRDPWPHAAVVIGGGAEWGDWNSDAADPGFMGSWPIGRDCHRKHAMREATDGT